MTAAAACLMLALSGAPADGEETIRILVFLAERRPIFLRLRITSGGRPLEAAWLDAVRSIHAGLDRNHDGKLSKTELDEKAFAAIVRLATGAPQDAAASPPDADRDGSITVDELAEAWKSALGPFRLTSRRRMTSGRTDALFEQLDRDKDEALRRLELATIAGSLRPLDLDDDEMIAATEIEAPGASAASELMEQVGGRRSREAALAPAIELTPGESSLRLARTLIRKYDWAPDGRPIRLDDRLSPEEFAIGPSAFETADTNHDGDLDARELRAYLAKAPIDLSLNVDISPDAAGRSTIQVAGGGKLAEGARVRQLADGDIELAVGPIRLDIRIEPPTASADEARRSLTNRFKAADGNQDGFLDGKEREALDAGRSPLAGLRAVLDRDGDGKVTLQELLDLGDRQAAAARRRLLATVDDEARAIFGILDTDRDRRLSAREVMRTVDRVLTWDADTDGRVTPDEIPYHFLLTIARGGLPGLTGANPNVSAPAISTSEVPSSAPDWFRKMDANQDGDISRREFLGPRDAFEHLDRDKDGLIDTDEARGAGVRGQE